MVFETRQRGSALMLMPAAVLVVFVLGAIAVDQSYVFIRQRDLVVAAQAAANDAVGYGIDVDSFYGGGLVAFDLDRANEAAGAALAARGFSETPLLTLDPSGTRLLISVESTVAPLFASAIPGAGDQRISAHTSAALVRR